MMLETANGRKASKKAQAVHTDPSNMKAGNWDPKVGIHRVTWNEGSGLARAGMLAMGSASGLGVVQIVEPKWNSGTDPKKFDGA
jgi:transcription factor C subunit 6